ncbi:hypothetical protein [Candidatus Synchoanobacter obligatus]|uniref:Uncharacterized protein n=1 Tax=Candidatus Synchoanobacter obligatus TaxID=2919597 RepID=A0ABT1L3W9_9GAMM|nr:hypothetical protein [Candidatus Synchoanobacter obligatus]MCP8351880.1 hypothetical protein [Candidatus Synchoanobacter obligatus]
MLKPQVWSIMQEIDEIRSITQEIDDNSNQDVSFCLKKALKDYDGLSLSRFHGSIKEAMQRDLFMSNCLGIRQDDHNIAGIAKKIGRWPLTVRKEVMQGFLTFMDTIEDADYKKTIQTQALHHVNNEKLGPIIEIYIDKKPQSSLTEPVGSAADRANEGAENARQNRNNKEPKPLQAPNVGRGPDGEGGTRL